MASNSKKRRRVLGASCILAALIIASSSFAWFTSKDEVTNRLSASANYGVSIAEDFTPPENWLPGQKVDKNVGVVNTGNVDAFVRTWLEGEMRLVAQNTSATTAASMSSVTPTAVTDQQLKDVGLTFKYSDGVYLKELSTSTITNPDTQSAASPEAYSDVMAVQAGGELAYTSGTQYKFKTSNQAMSVTNSAGAIQHIAANTEYTVTIDSTATYDIVVSGTTITLKNLSDFRTIDSNTFEPVSDGLYIFRRNANLTAGSPTSGSEDDYEYSGYYYKTIGTDKHYFALEYVTNGSQRSDYVLPDGAVTVTLNADNNYSIDTSNVKMFTASQTVSENNDLKWKYISADITLTPYTKAGTTTYVTNESTPKYYSTLANFVSGTGASAIDTSDDSFTAGTPVTYSAHRMLVAKDNIIIDIALSSIGSSAENWTAKEATDKMTTFYYNNDLEEGATTAQLVDSVKMDPSVSNNDYIAFDFDLNVKMDSVQVTVAENGDEGFDTVTSWAAGSTNVGATGAAGTVTNGEITLISWS